MNISRLLPICILAVSSTCVATCQIFGLPIAIGPKLEWVRQFGTGGQDVGQGVAVDPTGNVLVSGHVNGSLAGPHQGEGDTFLRKYDSAGSAIWTRQRGSNRDDQSTGVASDANGNAFITGWTRGDLGGPNVGAEDSFIIKYDASGIQQWTRMLGTQSNDIAFRVTADGLGNSFITGVTRGELGGSNPLFHDEAFLAKYDGSGSLQWVRQFGPDVEQISYDTACDSIGNVYISGYRGSTSYPGGLFNPFVTKYDSAGTLLWTRQLGTTNNANSFGVAVDGQGNVVIAGSTGQNIGGPPAGQADSYLAKYNASGDLLWTRQFGTGLNEITNDVATDELGNIYVAGHTTGSLGSANAGINDAFVAKYDSSGNQRWIAQIGTEDSDQAYAVAADESGAVYISGYTSGSLLGSSHAGSIDAFVAKFVEVPEPSAELLAAFSVAVVLTMRGNSRQMDHIASND